MLVRITATYFNTVLILLTPLLFKVSWLEFVVLRCLEFLQPHVAPVGFLHDASVRYDYLRAHPISARYLRAV